MAVRCSRISALLQGQLDAFHEQVIDFAFERTYRQSGTNLFDDVVGSNEQVG